MNHHIHVTAWQHPCRVQISAQWQFYPVVAEREAKGLIRSWSPLAYSNNRMPLAKPTIARWLLFQALSVGTSAGIVLQVDAIESCVQHVGSLAPRNSVVFLSSLASLSLGISTGLLRSIASATRCSVIS